MAPSLHWPRRRSEARLGPCAGNPVAEGHDGVIRSPRGPGPKVLPLSFRNASILISYHQQSVSIYMKHIVSSQENVLFSVWYVAEREKLSQPQGPPNQLPEIRERLGMSQASSLNWLAQPCSRDRTIGKREGKLSQEWMFRLAPPLRANLPTYSRHRAAQRRASTSTSRVKVLGMCRPGCSKQLWNGLPEDQFEMTVVLQAPYNRLPAFGLKVIGPSMDMEFPEDRTWSVCDFMTWERISS